MPKEKILVIDDEEDILELIRYNLTRDGYQVECVTSGEAGLSALKISLPDIIILDLMLPGLDGLDVCKQLKSSPQFKSIPIIMLSARGDEADIVAGLELGAEDYVTKPFSPRVLTARIKSILKRASVLPSEESALLAIEDLVIDPGKHQVLAAGKPVELTNTEFRVLHFLARQRGLVFSRHQIVDGVRGGDYPVTDRSVDVQIVGLRKKLGASGHLIETVRGVGYRFKDAS